MTNRTFLSNPLAKAVAIGLATFLPLQAISQEDESVERIEVTGSLGSLPGQDVEAVFGKLSDQFPPTFVKLLQDLAALVFYSDQK